MLEQFCHRALAKQGSQMLLLLASGGGGGHLVLLLLLLWLQILVSGGGFMALASFIPAVLAARRLAEHSPGTNAATFLKAVLLPPSQAVAVGIVPGLLYRVFVYAGR